MTVMPVGARDAAPALVTGATGFIGSRLVARMRTERRPVRALTLPGDDVPGSWDKEVELVIGSGGSKRIRTVITQVISHIVDFKLSVIDAVNAPRIHWDGATIQVEPGFTEESLATLTKIGTVNEWTEKNVYFGGVHAVMPNCQGAGDPRRGGDSRTLCEG